MSGNHNQSLERALDIVSAAAKAGADAIKLQTYTPDTMTLDITEDEFLITEADSLWHGKSFYSLYAEAQTPWEWHQPIFDRARELDMVGFSSPFDESAVDFLESLNISLYKIASFECIDLPLVKKVASTGKPVIISTGMATWTEIEETVQTARDAGCTELTLLKCTSSYPASPRNSNLLTIPDMRASFNCSVGLSDHTPGIGAAVASVTLGATIIEKHLTLDRNDGGVDSRFSLEPNEFGQLVTETKRAFQALGKISYGPTNVETTAKHRRRSIYITKDVQSGDILSKNNIRCIRPGLGLPPKYYQELLGQRFKFDAPLGTPLRWDLIE
mgnify:CR=1 FL=1|jgi:pseudaminic acid synthase